MAITDVATQRIPQGGTLTSQASVSISGSLPPSADQAGGGIISGVVTSITTHPPQLPGVQAIQRATYASLGMLFITAGLYLGPLAMGHAMSASINMAVWMGVTASASALFATLLIWAVSCRRP